MAGPVSEWRLMRRFGCWFLLLCLVLAGGLGPPAASAAAPKGAPADKEAPADHWHATASCPRDVVAPRDYNRCLYDARRASEQALEAEVDNAMAVIDARSDLAPVQRSRWKNLLDESQSRFLIFRNFDCQSVAPYEGPRGIGNFEQRNLCLIEVNIRRARDLRERYGDVPKEVARPKGVPEARAGAWIHPTSQPVD